MCSTEYLVKAASVLPRLWRKEVRLAAASRIDHHVSHLCHRPAHEVQPLQAQHPRKQEVGLQIWANGNGSSRNHGIESENTGTK